jgi:uncharacterized protein involved in exopolysaccharide biosynthesis
MIDFSRWASTRVAAFGVTGLILLVGVILLVRIASRPAFEAAAEMVLEEPRPRALFAPEQDFPPPNNALLDREREVLESTEVAQLASALLTGDAHVDSLLAGHSRITGAPPIDCQGCVFDAALVERSLKVEIPMDSNQVKVRFRADDPAVAREGANAVVYAYVQVRSQDPSIQFGVDVGITALSLAQTPTRRADRPSGSAVVGFLIVASMPVLVPWSRVAKLAATDG